jgi:hypothetical protein
MRNEIFESESQRRQAEEKFKHDALEYLRRIGKEIEKTK